MIEPECLWDGRIKLGCASIYMKKESTVSKFCYDYVNNVLNTYGHLPWDSIGPVTIENVMRNILSLLSLLVIERLKPVVILYPG